MQELGSRIEVVPFAQTFLFNNFEVWPTLHNFFFFFFFLSLTCEPESWIRVCCFLSCTCCTDTDLLQDLVDHVPGTVEDDLGFTAVLEFLEDWPEVGAAHRLESAHCQLVLVLLDICVSCRGLEQLLQPDQTCSSPIKLVSTLGPNSIIWITGDLIVQWWSF